MPLDVRLSPAAHHQFAEYKARAATKPGGAHATLWNGLQKLVRDVISNEIHAVDARNRLHGDLHPLCRVKMGRYRVLYIVSTAQKRVWILLIGYRKAGARDDAYEDFEKQIHRGTFDAQFAEAGIARPKV